MRFAYADPPYFGCCGLYDHYHGTDGRCWNDLQAHLALVCRLNDEFEDGWAMSASSPSLRSILPLCPDDVRVGVWVKPFASFKPNVNPAYTWEPVLWRGGRDFTRQQPTVRDYHSAVITLRRGFTGAKPNSFSYWIFDLLNMQPDDEFVDVFPGSGAVARAYEAWKRHRTHQETLELGA